MPDNAKSGHRFMPASSQSVLDESNAIQEMIRGLSAQVRSLSESNAELLAEVKRQGELINGLLDGPSNADLDERAERREKDQRNWMYDEMERHAKDSKTRDAHAMIYLEQLYRKEDWGEKPYEAQKRLFYNIPPATGHKRTSQMATARLMSELDRICSSLGVDYWFAYGTLIAAVYRNGSIPWDDDIDICIKRSDIRKLQEHLTGDNPDAEMYQVTVVYDRFVKCRQVRFSSRDANIPVFIDLSIWDDAAIVSEEADDRLTELRLALMEELEEACHDESSPLRYWDAHPFLRASGSAGCSQVVDVDWDGLDEDAESAAVGVIEAVFAKYQNIAEEEGLLSGDGTGLAYGMDNIYDAPWRRVTWPAGMFLPTVSCKYDGYKFQVPAKYIDVCQECYPGSPYLPNDIIGHDHFAEGALSSDKVTAALEAFAAGK